MNDMSEYQDPFDTGPDWLLDSPWRVKLLIAGLFVPIVVVMVLWAVGVLHS